MPEIILLDEPGAFKRVTFDGEWFLLFDRQGEKISETKKWTGSISVIPLTPAQAIELAQWILSTVPSSCPKG